MPGSETSGAAPLGIYLYSDIYTVVKWLFGFFLLSGGCFKPCPVAKETKTQLFCQKEICAVMSFHNCLRIANHGLSLPLDLCQRTLASIKDGWLFGFFPFFLIFFFFVKT